MTRGASAWQTLWNVIIPLSKPGIAIGSIFVVTIVMGDFITFGVMGGEQIASAGKVVETRLNALQFPPAAANAVILLAVDDADHRRAQPHRRHPQRALSAWARDGSRRVLLARRVLRACSCCSCTAR